MDRCIIIFHLARKVEKKEKEEEEEEEPGGRPSYQIMHQPASFEGVINRRPGG